MDCGVALSGLYASGVKRVGETLPDVLGSTKVCVCVWGGGVCVCIQQCNPVISLSTQAVIICLSASQTVG